MIHFTLIMSRLTKKSFKDFPKKKLLQVNRMLLKREYIRLTSKFTIECQNQSRYKVIISQNFRSCRNSNMTLNNAHLPKTFWILKTRFWDMLPEIWVTLSIGKRQYQISNGEKQQVSKFNWVILFQRDYLYHIRKSNLKIIRVCGRRKMKKFQLLTQQTVLLNPSKVIKVG